MILQSSYVVVDCPICGRPLEIQSQFVSHKITCGHCRGEFVVHEKNDGSLATTHPRRADLQSRAEQLLRTKVYTNLPDSDCCCQQRLPLVSIQDDKLCCDDSLNTSSKEVTRDRDSQLTVLLVEPRDEVFARIATDLAEFGMRVVRAKSATEALQLVERLKPVLLVGNVDLPGQSGWLMTAKLRLFDRRIRVWLYRHQPSNYGQEIARFLDIRALLTHHGDLLGLSDTVIDLMKNLPHSHGGADDSDRAEESTAA